MVKFFGYAFRRDAFNDTTRKYPKVYGATKISALPEFGAQEGTRTPTMLLAST